MFEEIGRREARERRIRHDRHVYSNSRGRSKENDMAVLMRRKGFEFAVENDVQGFDISGGAAC